MIELYCSNTAYRSPTGQWHQFLISLFSVVYTCQDIFMLEECLYELLSELLKYLNNKRVQLCQEGCFCLSDTILCQDKTYVQLTKISLYFLCTTSWSQHYGNLLQAYYKRVKCMLVTICTVLYLDLIMGQLSISLARVWLTLECINLYNISKMILWGFWNAYFFYKVNPGV